MKFVFLLIYIFIYSSFVSAKTPDILVYSKTDREWTLFLVDEFKQIMDNFSIDINPYSMIYDEAIVYDDTTIHEFITPEVESLVKKVQEASKLDLLTLKPELTINNFGYEVSKIIPQTKPVEDKRGDVTFQTELSLQGLKVFASNVELKLMLKDLQGKNLQALKVIVLNPLVKIDPKDFVKFKFDLRFKEDGEKISLYFDHSDFQDLITYLREKPESIKLSFDDIRVPEVSLRVMGRDIVVNTKKIKETLSLKKEEIEAILVEQLISIMEKEGAFKLLQKLDDTTFNKTRWFNKDSLDGTVLSLTLNDFSVARSGEILRTEINGNFCTPYKFYTYREECFKYSDIKAFDRLKDIDLAKSEENILNKLSSNKDIKFSASISENYVNKIVSHTIEMGYWNEIIEDMGISLGKNAISVRMNKDKNHATVLIDAIKDVGKFKGALLKERYLNFPIVLSVDMKIEYREADLVGGAIASDLKATMPHLILTITDVDLSDETLINGIKEFKIDSTIKNVSKAFRKIVLRTIKAELSPYKNKGTELPGLMLPEIYNLKLEKAKIESDSFGRLNVTLKESDLKN